MKLGLPITAACSNGDRLEFWPSASAGLEAWLHILLVSWESWTSSLTSTFLDSKMDVIILPTMLSIK